MLLRWGSGLRAPPSATPYTRLFTKSYPDTVRVKCEVGRTAVRFFREGRITVLAAALEAAGETPTAGEGVHRSRRLKAQPGLGHPVQAITGRGRRWQTSFKPPWRPDVASMRDRPYRGRA